MFVLVCFCLLFSFFLFFSLFFSFFFFFLFLRLFQDDIQISLCAVLHERESQYSLVRILIENDKKYFNLRMKRTFLDFAEIFFSFSKRNDLSSPLSHHPPSSPLQRSQQHHPKPVTIIHHRSLSLSLSPPFFLDLKILEFIVGFLDLRLFFK